MMSSEEETDCFGLYGDKLLKKVKRSRQRVDAGEPRNSYSSIPNFSSRPSFLTGGLYGAFLSHQHFGLIAQGFGPNKMLNELFGRQVKQAADAATTADTMMAVDAAGSDGAVNFDCLNATSVIRRGLDEDGGSPPPGDVAHHMLRNILQGKKDHLFALEQELRGVSVSGGQDPPSPDNNNSISSNNNNNNNNNNNELKTTNGSVTNGENGIGGSETDGVNGPVKTLVSVNVNGISEADDETTAQDEELSQSGKNQQQDLLDDMVAEDSEPSCTSPASASPSDPKDDSDENPASKDSPTKTEAELKKRARVENIVSSMRSSPSLPTQVNGCKKRKLYHPQQHDNSAAERYAASLGLGVNMGMLMEDDDDDEMLEPQEIRQKRVEKDALKIQLRTMQEQLAEMQQKYVQLCTRMDQDLSECQDTEEVGSDLEQDGNSLSLPEKPPSSNPPSTPVKDTATVPSITPPVAQPIMSPAVSKMISAKLHSGSHHIPPGHPSMPIPPNFNGALSLLQQQVLQEQHNQASLPTHPHHHHPHHPHQMPPHHALSNAAAAMYLGVSHKLYLEQEARMAKEAAMAAEQHHQQLNQQHAGHHNQQQQQQQQMLGHHQQQQAQQQPPQPQTPQQQQSQSQSQQTGSQTPHSQPPSAVQTPTQNTTPTHQPSSHQQSPPQLTPHAKSVTEFSERLSMLRNSALSAPVSGTDLEGLADVLKTEITSSLSGLIDSIMARFVQQRRFYGKQSEAAAEQLNKDLLLASQLLDRKSPRSKVVDRGSNGAAERMNGPTNGVSMPQGPPRVNGTAFPSMANNVNNNTVSNGNGSNNNGSNNNCSNNNPENNINGMNLPLVRPSPNAAIFQPPKPPVSQINSAAAAALYSSMSSMGNHPGVNPFHLSEGREGVPEQNEALSLVVAPKKKRHKVTDTRITPKTVCRILAQDGMTGQPQEAVPGNQKMCGLLPSTSGSNGTESPPPRPYHPPPPMLPVSLPTSVAIPNPSLHESQVFSPYSPFYHQQAPHMPSASPPGMADLRDSPPLHPPTLLHPALLAAAQHGGSPDYANMRSSSGLGGGNDSVDRGSDCNSGDGPYDGITPTISFSGYQKSYEFSLTAMQSSTLTPMHLRKAKLMFFWVRYPSSAVLKMYFPDIKFNKNNTAQLVKWFSNFREFYYIQMEKYARQAVSEGVKNADDLHVSGDCEIYRVLNLHYNRNNHIEVCGPQVPSNFRYVVEQTLREFFKAIQGGKDTEQSWKKSIYKIISRLDDPVPEYFKSPNFLEQLE